MTDLWTSATTTTSHGRRHRALSADAVVVRRRINASPHQVRAALADPHVVGALQIGTLGADGWFELTCHPTPNEFGSEIGRGRARLHGAGFRLVLHTRVDVEITAWSHTSCEVSVQPAARAPMTWGARRLRRYFELGPLFADRICSTLAARIERASSPGVDRTITSRSAA